MSRPQPKKLEVKPQINRYGTNPKQVAALTPGKPAKPNKSDIADEQGMMVKPRVN